MKTSRSLRLFSSILSLLAVLPVFAEENESNPSAGDAPGLYDARILISRPSLDFNTRIEAAFPRAMVPEALVGQVADPPVATVSPDWDGQWVWVSPRVARWQPLETATLAATYTFSIHGDLVDLNGNPVPDSQPASTTSPDFQVVESGAPRAVEGIERPECPRQRPVAVVFNAPVDPETLAAAVFIDSEDHEIEPVWRSARRAELSNFRHRLPWHKSILAGQVWAHHLSAEQLLEELDWAYVAHPAESLPVGKNWKLRLPADLHARGQNDATLPEPVEVNWGSVTPGEVAAITPLSGVGIENQIVIRFDKHPSPDLAEDPATLAEYIRFSPLLPGDPPTATLHGQSLHIHHPGLEFNRTFGVAVQEGMPMADGLPLSQGSTGSVRFTPAPGGLELPSSREILIPGNGAYAFNHVNLQSFRVRIKEIDRGSAATVLRAFESYNPEVRRTGDGRRSGYPVTYDLVPGNEIHDQRITPPTGRTNVVHRQEMDLNEILGTPRATSLFLQVEGLAREDGSASWEPVVVAQAFLQFSDIGFAWKTNRQEATFFVFSHNTGEALPEARLSLHDRDGNRVAQIETDESGLARLPKETAYRQNLSRIAIEKGGDLHISPFSLEDSTWSPWRIAGFRNASFAWGPPADQRLSAHLFADREVYRPGEDVNFAALVRLMRVHLPTIPEALSASISLRDPQGRVLETRQIDSLEGGLAAATFSLPPATAGYFHIAVELNGPDNPGDDAAIYRHHFLVQDFTRNTFEIDLDLATGEASDSLSATIAAHYLLGAPVGEGEVRWTARFESQRFQSPAFSDFRFTDHMFLPWHIHSGGDAVHHAQGEAELGVDGRAAFSLTPPSADEIPGPTAAYLFAHVTDPNGQTLAASQSLDIHSSEFYIGVGETPYFVREGEPFTLGLAAVTPAHAAFTEDVEVDVSIARRTWEAVEVATAGGGTTIRQQPVLTEEAEAVTASIRGGIGEVSVTLPGAGEFVISLSSTDPSGQPVLTRFVVNAVGAGENLWEAAPGASLTVLPERDLYQPGETARLLVKSPVAGLALVTIERDTVERAFITRLDGPDSVIEIPLTDMHAPNIHVGVILLQGAAETGLEHPMPRARAGYAEITVDHRLSRLAVEIEPATSTVRPGESAAIEILVRDHQQRPLPDTRVVFYAVDEGVLSLTGYQNPDPRSRFHAPRDLRVFTGTSLGRLLATNPDSWDFSNKGYVIGGGEDFIAPPLDPRQDFTPCAFWSADLVTNENGIALAVFDMPDTLTRYRLIAVAASADGWRFGTGESSIEVNKPLMIDPAAPRFAHLGDQVEVRARVFNHTDGTGRFAAILTPGSEARVESPAAVEIELAPGESAQVEHLVRFIEPGNTTWRWQLEPREWSTPPSQGELTAESDTVEHTFEVVHTIPMLRETYAARLRPGETLDLLEGANADLLTDEGRVTVRAANSRLVEALAAANHISGYPYGCAEQTISGLAPWLAAAPLRDLMAAPPSAEEVESTIRDGLRHLATMITPSGGLAYWSGGSEPSLWSSVHAAHVLVVGRNQGTEIPDSLLEPLLDYIATQLRGIDSAQPRDLPFLVRGLAVLALAGQPDAGYQNKLIDKQADLDTDSLLYLALAMATADPADDGVPRLLAAAASGSTRELRHWFPTSQRQALRLSVVLAGEFPRTVVEDELDKLLALRDHRGHWSSTYSNAWALLALADYHQQFENNFGPAEMNLTWPNDRKTLSLGPVASSASIDIGLPDLGASPALEISISEGNSPVYLSTTLAARPAELPTAGGAEGLGIERRYLRVMPDGTPEESDVFRVGDLVVVELILNHESDDLHFLVIDDPLPSTLEAIHPDFTSRVGTQEISTLTTGGWISSHTELRDDRALFFCDRIWNPGSSTIRYLARVVRAGEVFAPPPLVEAMYRPAQRALGEGHPFVTVRR